MSDPAPLFRISLAQWSLHRTLWANDLSTLEFPAYAAEQLGIFAVEYVNTFFKDKAEDRGYLDELRRRAADSGVSNLLIMVDREGDTGHPVERERTQAIENHRRWMAAAKQLGCHAIRVNVRSQGSPDEQRTLVADGLHRLAELAEDFDLDVLVENHGGLSSNAAWLRSAIERADHPRLGTLPDFGNWFLDPDMTEWYDRYEGVAELMPLARAISAKSYAFDDAGNVRESNYERLLRIVLDAGYRGFIGIEYEGTVLNEDEGIVATKRLLERLRDALAPEYFPGPAWHVFQTDE